MSSVVYLYSEFTRSEPRALLYFYLLTSLDWGEWDGSELESEKEEEDDSPQSQGVLVVDPWELEVGEGGPLVVGDGDHTGGNIASRDEADCWLGDREGTWQ